MEGVEDEGEGWSRGGDTPTDADEAESKLVLTRGAVEELWAAELLGGDEVEGEEEAEGSAEELAKVEVGMAPTSASSIPEAMSLVCVCVVFNFFFFVLFVFVLCLIFFLLCCLCCLF